MTKVVCFKRETLVRCSHRKRGGGEKESLGGGERVSGGAFNFLSLFQMMFPS